MASSTEERQIAFKHTLDVYGARSDRQWFEETYGTRHTVVAPKVWAKEPPFNDAASAVLQGLAVQEVQFTLTLDPFSAGRVWVAKLSPGVWPYIGPQTDWTALELQRVKHWISPTVFGPSYQFVLYQGNGSPIPTGNWEFLFSEGLLHLDDGFSASEMGWVTPLKWTAYRYIGPFLSDSLGVTVVPFDSVAQVDVVHGLGRHPVVQVLREETGGMFGFGGMGGGFGSSTVMTIMEEANFEIYHMDLNSFSLVMNNYYTGELMYS